MNETEIILNELVVNIERKLQNENMSIEETFNFLGCFIEYNRSFNLLKQYDEEADSFSPDYTEIEEAEGYVIEVEKANVIIQTLKFYFIERGKKIGNFAVVQNGGIDQVIKGIYQTYGGEELYPTLADKAVNLFYLLIKDHIFVDGNKRIASFLFLWFLDMNNMLVIDEKDNTINYMTIYALAIFVAGSNPKDKDAIVQLIRTLVMTHKKSLSSILD